MFSIFGKNNYNTISVHDLDDKTRIINLIDVRESNEYKAGHVPTAKNIPMRSVLAQPEKYLDKLKEYHIICQSGARSSSTCKALSSQGFQVINVSGGTGSYIHSLER